MPRIDSTPRIFTIRQSNELPMLTATRSLGLSILAPSLRYKRIIVCALGVLLLVAAGLKLVGQNVAPYAQFGFLIHPSMQLAAVEWEIVLGLWLVFGSRSGGGRGLPR
jgi:hypothetical protein